MAIPDNYTAKLYVVPEIAYLQNGVNGIMVADPTDPLAYANPAAHLLNDDAARQQLVRGCQSARNEYTVEKMLNRFTEGGSARPK